MLRLEFGLLLQIINTSVIRRSILMKGKNNKQLTAMRAYRFTPTLAHIIYARARSLNINESEFVRRVLMDAIKEIK